MTIPSIRIVPIFCFCACVSAINGFAQAQGVPHVHSMSGNGPSHSVSKIVNKDGSYSLCESYMNGWTGERWSTLYTSWDNEWSYYGDHPLASSSDDRSTNQPKTPPVTIRTKNAIRPWTKNPFYKAKKN